MALENRRKGRCCNDALVIGNENQNLTWKTQRVSPSPRVCSQRQGAPLKNPHSQGRRPRRRNHVSAHFLSSVSPPPRPTSPSCCLPPCSSSTGSVLPKPSGHWHSTTPENSPRLCALVTFQFLSGSWSCVPLLYTLNGELFGMSYISLQLLKIILQVYKGEFWKIEYIWGTRFKWRG